MSDTLKWTMAPVSSVRALTWKPAQDFPSPYTSSAEPALATFQDELWIVHCGGGSNTNLWYSVYTDKDGWRKGEWQIPNAQYPATALSKPSLTVYDIDNQLCCTYLGLRDSNPAGKGNVSIVSIDAGQSWMRPAAKPILSLSAPAVAILEEALWIVFRHEDSNELWSALLYPTGDVDEFEMGGEKTSAAPALATFQNKLWCVYRGDGNDNKLYVKTSGDGRDWSAGVPMGGQTSDCAPTLVSVPDQDILMCIYGDSKGGPKLYCTYSVGDPSAWSYAMGVNDNPRTPGSGAGLAYYQGNFFAVYRSA